MSQGHPTRTPAYTEASVAATTTAVLAANANRVGVTIENHSDVVIFLRIGESAVKDEGHRLNPLGGDFVMSPQRGNLSLAAINGITATGSSKVVLVTEWVAP